jgi:hypothetical protein
MLGQAETLSTVTERLDQDPGIIMSESSLRVRLRHTQAAAAGSLSSCLFLRLLHWQVSDFFRVGLRSIFILSFQLGPSPWQLPNHH